MGPQNYTPDETNDVNNAVSCYKEAVQFSASLVTSVFAGLCRNLGIANEFCIYIVPVTLLLLLLLLRGLNTRYVIHSK